MIQAGIIGGAGYTGGELIRLLLAHPEVNLKFVMSRSQANKAIHDIHPDLLGITNLKFASDWSKDVDVLFLAMGHGASSKFLSQNDVSGSIAVIDLSSDFRIKDAKHDFVYGLPELNKEAITQSMRIANCGCFATAIQLALLPVASEQAIPEEVHIHALTGSTGAGQEARPTTHFSWRDNNISVYKAFEHQHLVEINQSLKQAQPKLDSSLNFIPMRGNFSRGIFATLYFQTDWSAQELKSLYSDYYLNEPFTHISEHNPSLKQVVNTNRCILHVQKKNGKAFIISAIDNLLKGASGQAVQNMNLVFGLEEECGLRLKASVF